MKTPKLVEKILLICLTLCIAGCKNTTLLNTVPQGAKVYMNEAYKGVTPYTHRDSKIVGTRTRLRLEKEGYQPLETVLTRNERPDPLAIGGGVLALFPFLWTMGYDPEHTYELRPVGAATVSTNTVLSN
jgi:hypothetical protein